MKFPKMFLTRWMIAVVAFAMCGAPEAAQALAQDAQQPQTVPAQQVPQQQPNRGTTIDPSQGPLTPVPAQTPPDAPSSTVQQQPTPTTTPVQQPTTQQQQQRREPLGAAAAEGVRTSGGSASRPAGSAIAPAKQRQVRALLIKLGAIAAAGAAIGTVYALSKGTSSTPPNSGR
ncbi:MAG TPA: hypothetical protein VN622_11390 [Clostridia bacterium]|nr:hypothetical protein [Clostridia bacterium]